MTVASWYAIKIKSDKMIAHSGPISVGIPVLAARYIVRKKLIIEVRDLWPQGAIEMGIIRHKFLIGVFYWFEKVCYNSPSLIIILSPVMKLDILSRFPHLNVISLTKSANLEMFWKSTNGWILPEENK